MALLRAARAVFLAQDAEADPAKRAFTREELQAFFDHADAQVDRIRGAGRKGWLPAFRDATLFKVAYGYGLRRHETQMLEVADFGRNPHAPEFGDVGVCYVRYGKAKNGSPPKRRSVLTVWAWVAEILAQWTAEVRPLLAGDGNLALWPSERAPRVGLQQLDARFAACRDALGLPRGLDLAAAGRPCQRAHPAAPPGVTHPAELANRRPPARPADGLRRAPHHRQAATAH